MAQKDFFISYNGKDQVWAEWIAWTLEEAKYEVVIQAWDFRPGGNFILEMHRAAQETEATVLVLSQNYLDAEYTYPEWAAAFVDDPQGNKRKLIPFRIGKCQPQGLLQPIIFTDLVGLSESEVKEAILKALKVRAKPTSSPKFPSSQPRAIEKAPRFPGSLPPIWNIPHNRNPNFTGRGQLLEDLRMTLSTSKTAVVTQAITGLGGVGKTQTAIEYAYRHSSEYDVVWWVKSEKPETLAADYAELVQELNLPEKDLTDQPAVIKAVRQWFGQHEKWLLIFDNAEDPQEIRKTYLPQGGNGHVLITSRNPNWGATAQTVGINTLKENEAVEFLRKRTGEKDQESTTVLAKELGCLPLALEQAAAYILATGISLSKYVELAKEHKVDLLKEGDKPSDYPDTVLTTWNLSFQKVKQENPAASDLLKAFAFLAPDDIPLSLLKGINKVLPEELQELGENELELNRALKMLLTYSLIERNNEKVSIHRLVQAVLKNQMRTEDKKEWAAAMVRLLNNKFPFKQKNPETWKYSGLLLPHANIAGEIASELKVGLDDAGTLFNNMGLFLQQIRAQYCEAQLYLEKAIAISLMVYGPNNNKEASRLSNLGTLHLELGNLSKAQNFFERAIQIYESPEIQENTGIFFPINNLGGVLLELGDFKGAKSQLGRALEIGERIYGLASLEVALILNNLGRVFHELGDLELAKEKFERVLEINKEKYSPHSHYVAITLMNLGGVLKDLQDLPRARTCIVHALRIYKNIYPSKHPKFGKGFNNLGLVHSALGNLRAAKAWYERALQIDEKNYGKNHQEVAIRLANLGNVYQALGNVSEAKQLFSRALEVFLCLFGENHTKTQMVRKYLELLNG